MNITYRLRKMAQTGTVRITVGCLARPQFTVEAYKPRRESDPQNLVNHRIREGASTLRTAVQLAWEEWRKP